MEVHSRHLGPPLQHQVFVNFRGEELRCGFVSHLVEALQRHGINVFIDSLERKGEDLINLFARIEESTIALVIFSERYTESIWCLDELLKIKQRADQGFLKVRLLASQVQIDTCYIVFLFIFWTKTHVILTLDFYWFFFLGDSHIFQCGTSHRETTQGSIWWSVQGSRVGISVW